jgi:hypothetical protein
LADWPALAALPVRDHADFDVLSGSGRAYGKHGDRQGGEKRAAGLFHHFLPERLARLMLINVVKSIPLTRTKAETI